MTSKVCSADKNSDNFKLRDHQEDFSGGRLEFQFLVSLTFYGYIALILQNHWSQLRGWWWLVNPKLMVAFFQCHIPDNDRIPQRKGNG